MKDDIMKSSGVVIENLNLSFGDTHVLKGVNLNIEAGEFFAFLGPSFLREFFHGGKDANFFFAIFLCGQLDRPCCYPLSS